MEELRAEARYARERYDLYRAKTYSMRPTSPVRLRELERAHELAQARLRNAEQELRRTGEGSPTPSSGRSPGSSASGGERSPAPGGERSS